VRFLVLPVARQVKTAPVVLYPILHFLERF
jgi:hypothetical protein